MNLRELTDDLPWGLHDAHLERLELDWPQAAASLTVRFAMSERQDLDRRGRIDLTGLVFCAIDPPEIAPDRSYVPTPKDGLWLNDGEGVAPGAKGTYPSVPKGCFLHWFFVHQWNRFIHVCAREATLVWLDPAPVASRSATRALFPGDEIPDPDDPSRLSGA
jgi:hypothetical protein